MKSVVTIPSSLIRSSYFPHYFQLLPTHRHSGWTRCTTSWCWMNAFDSSHPNCFVCSKNGRKICTIEKPFSTRFLADSTSAPRMIPISRWNFSHALLRSLLAVLFLAKPQRLYFLLLYLKVRTILIRSKLARDTVSQNRCKAFIWWQYTLVFRRYRPVLFLRRDQSLSSETGPLPLRKKSHAS